MVSPEHALQNMSHLFPGYIKVVDTFADARQNDLQNLAEEMEDEIEHDRKALAKLFAKIDKDNSGQLLVRIFLRIYFSMKVLQFKVRPI